MRKIQAIVISFLVAGVVVAGTLALTKTTRLGAETRTQANKNIETQIASRSHKLNTLEASLHQALAKKPPALPHLPKIHPPKISSSPTPVQSTPRFSTPPRTVVVVAQTPPTRSVPTLGQRNPERNSGEQDD